MIFDLNTAALSDVHGDYSVCIAGAGVAGITLASDLADRGLRVLLLEAGDLDYSELSQDVYRGYSVGRSYDELDTTRLRYLGGTSNHWGGICRPLDAWDLARHDHVPHSGWPITKTELDRHLKRATEILEVPNNFADYDVDGSANGLLRIGFQWSPPVRFGQKYLQELKESERISLFLNANLVDIHLNETGDRAVEFQCANYVDASSRFTFTASIFVLAMGGIENPRMMLNFRSQIPTGLGNSNDLVGRYFAEHLNLFGGYYVTERENWPFENVVDVAPTPDFMTQAKIANARLVVHEISGAVPLSFDEAMERIFCSEEIIQDFVRIFNEKWCPTTVDAFGKISVVSEQVPNRMSRVYLAHSTDRFGLRRSTLDWRLTDIDRRTITQLMMSFGVYLARQRYGNVKLADWMLDHAESASGIGGGSHHMGTTRMAPTPEEGVVDENCRVFGLSNLFVAGSSVFPTGGHANPTLTIVQLTLRLGEHLAKILSY